MSIDRLESISLRPPTLFDGAAITQLIHQCPPLDTNSAYCNLLQCSHFSKTSVVAEDEGEVVGFISGYLIPDRQNTLFIWQVAVSKKARGIGLASRMLDWLTNHQNNHENWLETTITDNNKASWSLFEGFARNKKTDLKRSTMFDSAQHFNHKHDTEYLVRIGPF